MLQHLCFTRIWTSLLRVNFHKYERNVFRNEFCFISKKFKLFPALECIKWLLIACLLNLSSFHFFWFSSTRLWLACLVCCFNQTSHLSASSQATASEFYARVKSLRKNEWLFSWGNKGQSTKGSRGQEQNSMKRKKMEKNGCVEDSKIREIFVKCKRKK